MERTSKPPNFNPSINSGGAQKIIPVGVVGQLLTNGASKLANDRLAAEVMGAVFKNGYFKFLFSRVCTFTKRPSIISPTATKVVWGLREDLGEVGETTPVGANKLLVKTKDLSKKTVRRIKRKISKIGKIFFTSLLKHRHIKNDNFEVK